MSMNIGVNITNPSASGDTLQTMCSNDITNRHAGDIVKYYIIVGRSKRPVVIGHEQR